MMEPIDPTDEMLKEVEKVYPDSAVAKQVFVGPSSDIKDLGTIVTRDNEGTRIHTFWKPNAIDIECMKNGGFVEFIVWADHLHPVGNQVWGM